MKLILALLLALGTASAQGVGAGRGGFVGGSIPASPSSGSQYNGWENQTGLPSAWHLNTGTEACAPSCPTPYGGTNSITYNATSPLGNVGMLSSLTNTGSGYYWNSLQNRQWRCYDAPALPITVTTGTTTVTVTAMNPSPYNVVGGTQSITISASGSDTGSAITTIQIIVDGSTTPAYDSKNAGPITQTLSPYGDGTVHTFAVKAWTSTNNSVTQPISITFGKACGNVFTHMTEEIQFEIPSGQTVYQYEFDPDVFFAGYRYVISMACRQNGTAPLNEWYFWDSLNYKWALNPSGVHYPCTVAPGVKHDLKLYVAWDTVAHTQTYISMEYDGQQVYRNLNLSFNAPGGTSEPDSYNVQSQMDIVPNPNAQSTVRMWMYHWSMTIF